MSRITLGVFLSCCAVVAFAATSHNGLPLDLWDSADKHSCQDLDELYLFTETNNPPFAFGFIENEPDSAVYVCAWKEGTTPTLVIWRRGEQISSFDCSTVVASDKLTIGGIRLKRREVDISHYFVLGQDEWVRGPAVKITTTIIVTDRYGLTSELFCHGGVWYFNSYD